MTVLLRLLDRAAAEVVRNGECPPGMRCAPDYPCEGDRIAAAMYLERCAAGVDPGPFGVFLVCRNEPEPTVIGGVGFHGAPDDRGRVEIGYDIVPSARRKGFATAAVQALIATACRLGAKTLIAQTGTENVASQTVLRRCGFSVTGSDDRAIYLERSLSSASPPACPIHE